jgi:hypothetical protein
LRKELTRYVSKAMAPTRKDPLLKAPFRSKERTDVIYEWNSSTPAVTMLRTRCSPRVRLAQISWTCFRKLPQAQMGSFNHTARMTPSTIIMAPSPIKLVEPFIDFAALVDNEGAVEVEVEVDVDDDDNDDDDDEV